MSEKLAIRQMQPDDLPKLYSMVRPMYASERSREFLDWQCFRNIHPVTAMAAFSSGRMVGLFGIQKRYLNNGLCCGQGSWINIAPQWQGKGLFRELGERAMGSMPGVDVLCVIANATARGPLQTALGFRTIGAIDTLTLSTANVTQPRDLRRSRIDSTTEFSSAPDRQAKIMFCSSQEYRRWRYGESPANTYWKIERNATRYAVVKLFANATGRNMGDIVDIECPAAEEEDLKEIVLGATHHLKEIGAANVTLWALPGTTLRVVADNIGFKTDGRIAHFCVKVMKAGDDRLNDLSQWHIRQGDATNY